jgi:hypothetical protein
VVTSVQIYPLPTPKYGAEDKIEFIICITGDDGNRYSGRRDIWQRLLVQRLTEWCDLMCGPRPENLFY